MLTTKMLRNVVRTGLAIAAVITFNLVSPRAATASELDCTTGCNFVGYAGAIWSTSGAQSTGTGVIDSFVRIQGAAHSSVDGHNTDGTRSNDELGGSFTHAIQLSDVPIVDVNGRLYYEFFLDINQEKNEPLLALNNVQICLAGSGTLTKADGCPTSTSYTMGAFDGDINQWIAMNYNLNAGSGSGDLFMYIPVTTLGITMTDYVYLYSQFGAISGYENNDGFEEWAVRICGETYGGTVLACQPPPPAIPEPASLVLLGTGLVGLVAIARRRRA